MSRITCAALLVLSASCGEGQGTSPASQDLRSPEGTSAPDYRTDLAGARDYYAQLTASNALGKSELAPVVWDDSKPNIGGVRVVTQGEAQPFMRLGAMANAFLEVELLKFEGTSESIVTLQGLAGAEYPDVRGSIVDIEGGFATVRFPLAAAVPFLGRNILSLAGEFGSSSTTIDGAAALAEFEISAVAATDLSGDGVIDAADAAELFAYWGSGSARGDISGDGVVDAADAALLFADWDDDTASADAAPQQETRPVEGFAAWSGYQSSSSQAISGFGLAAASTYRVNDTYFVPELASGTSRCGSGLYDVLSFYMLDEPVDSPKLRALREDLIAGFLRGEHALRFKSAGFESALIPTSDVEAEFDRYIVVEPGRVPNQNAVRIYMCRSPGVEGTFPVGYTRALRPGGQGITHGAYFSKIEIASDSGILGESYSKNTIRTWRWVPLSSICNPYSTHSRCRERVVFDDAQEVNFATTLNLATSSYRAQYRALSLDDLITRPRLNAQDKRFGVRPGDVLRLTKENPSGARLQFCYCRGIPVHGVDGWTCQARRQVEGEPTREDGNGSDPMLDERLDRSEVCSEFHEHSVAIDLYELAETEKQDVLLFRWDYSSDTRHNSPNFPCPTGVADDSLPQIRPPNERFGYFDCYPSIIKAQVENGSETLLRWTYNVTVKDSYTLDLGGVTAGALPSVRDFGLTITLRNCLRHGLHLPQQISINHVYDRMRPITIDDYAFVGGIGAPRDANFWLSHGTRSYLDPVAKAASWAAYYVRSPESVSDLPRGFLPNVQLPLPGEDFDENCQYTKTIYVPRVDAVYCGLVPNSGFYDIVLNNQFVVQRGNASYVKCPGEVSDAAD